MITREKLIELNKKDEIRHEKTPLKEALDVLVEMRENILCLIESMILKENSEGKTSLVLYDYNLGADYADLVNNLIDKTKDTKQRNTIFEVVLFWVKCHGFYTEEYNASDYRCVIKW